MPEYDYHQRPQTTDYQDGWDLIWGDREDKEEEDENDDDDETTVS